MQRRTLVALAALATLAAPAFAQTESSQAPAQRLHPEKTAGRAGKRAERPGQRISAAGGDGLFPLIQDLSERHRTGR